MINIIAVGRYKERKVIVSTDRECFVVKKEKDDTLSVWTEGLLAEDGRDLVEVYKRTTPGMFGRFYNDLTKRHANDGFSERGTFDRKQLYKCLVEGGINIKRSDSDEIYDTVYNNKLLGLYTR